MKKYIKEICIISIIGILILSIAIINKNEEVTLLTSTNISDILNLDNTSIGWGIKRSDNHEQPDVGSKNKKIMDTYNGLYMGNSEQKYIYLTFDLGYEAGYTEKILEILKNNDVTAAFFITAHYVNTEPEIVQKMIDNKNIIRQSHGKSQVNAVM